MRQSLEPLVTKTVAPEPLPGLPPRARTTTTCAPCSPSWRPRPGELLDDELARLNRSRRPALDRLLPTLRRKERPAADRPRATSAPRGAGPSASRRTPTARSQPGDIEVVSEFAQPPTAGYGAGSKTQPHLDHPPRSAQTTPARDGRGAPCRPGTVLRPALRAIQDDRGPQTFLMTKDEIVIGREAADVWVDLRLETSLDVSREHARLQRTPGRATFRIKDLSKLGTTVNGTPVPSQPGGPDGEVRDLDRWVDLPDRARIGLAGVVFLDFERRLAGR